MKHKSKRGFTLVELLVVIAIIAVLLAVLMPAMRIAKALSQRVVCKNRLSGIGKSISFYADQYDSLLPSPVSDAIPTGFSFHNTRAPYEAVMDPDLNQATKNDLWHNLGCLYKSGLIPTGKQFYCPAHAAGLQQYDDYCYSGDLDASGNKIRVQWGTTWNWPTHTSASWWYVSVSKGYIFWPQSKQLVKTGELSQIPDEGSGSGAAGYRVGVRHAEGYPHTPAKYSEMNPNKAVSCDYAAHSVQGSGYNIQSVFADTHVNMQKVPVDPTDGTFWYPYQGTIPDGEPAAKWREKCTAIYMFALQP
jgi:prepilin-type N-terminal cleavage/methylation domain-containing protein